MTQFDRDQDWGKYQGVLARDHVLRKVPDLHAIQRAALSSTQITGDQHWDLMLSVVQHKIKDLEGKLEVALNRQRNSDDFTESVLINDKLAVRLIGHEIEALQWVSELPQILLENGDRAKKLLGTIDESPD
jgi:hypothetical protein